jgi:ABC-type nitrate/sulfonate/bicarbonate transport system substrate-binding protein
MIAPKSFVQKYPGISKKLVQAITQATREANANMAATKQRAVAEFGVPKDAVDLVFANIAFTTDLDWKLIKNFIATEKRVRFIKDVPDINSFVSRSFAKVVNYQQKKPVKKAAKKK